MRIFVTGASGWIGSAALPALIAAGHDVVGLARSDASAARIEQLGGTAVPGDIDDLEALRSGAAGAEGVVHLAYNHDFSAMEAAAATDRAAIEAFGEVLAGTGHPLLIASGTLGLASGRVGTEEDRPADGGHPRTTNAGLTLDLAERGIRSIVVRFAPTVHGGGDQGFVQTLARVARERGTSGYVGDGSNRWPAVHRTDAGLLVARAIDGAEPGSVLHATAEEGVSGRAIAEALAAANHLPVSSVPVADAPAHFGWIGMFFGADIPAASVRTRAAMSWEPTGPTLLEDIAAGFYRG